MKKLFVIFAVLGLIFALQHETFAQNNLGTPPHDGVYYKTNTPFKEPVPYTSLREADVMWAKRIWRVIDMRQKINIPFYYPLQEQNGRKSLMRIIYNSLKEGALTAYGSDNDEFQTPLTFVEVQRLLDKVDTVTLIRDYPPYDPYDTIISQPFDPTTVLMIRVKEDWFFDKQRSMLDVRIIGLCPITEEYDINGDYKGTRPLFWVYYPECRPIFARNEVFNRWSDQERRTYDDILTWKRFFGSYIYKESNVYDRRISQYAKGIDALLESERIRNEILDFEVDLWEY